MSVCLPSIWAKSVHHRSALGEPESPTISIRAHGLKGCLILLKNEICQNYVLTIPVCRGGRDEATVENRVEIGRRKCPHAPTRLLTTCTDARHASHTSSSPGWADPTRIPVDPTHVPNPDKDDVIMTQVYTVSTQSADMSSFSQQAMSLYSHQARHHSGSHWPLHQPRAAPRQVELSRAKWAELSRELRDKILCSGVYVQLDLRLNPGRSSGQNSFDQILTVWNGIWTISDLFPANLIIPDAMVRSDHWDLGPKVVVVN